MDGPVTYRVEVAGREFDVTIDRQGSALGVAVTEVAAGAASAAHHASSAAGAGPASPAVLDREDAERRPDARWLTTWQARAPSTYTLGLQPVGGDAPAAGTSVGWFGETLVSGTGSGAAGGAGAESEDVVGSTYWVALGGYQEAVRVAGARARRLAAALPRRAGAALRLDVRAPMPGRVVSVRVAAGAVVERGDLVITLEAMKMENELRASGSGRVQAVQVSAGDTVEHGALLLVIVPIEDAAGGAPPPGHPG